MIVSPISFSGTSSPKPSTATTAFSVLATTRSRSLFSSSSVALGRRRAGPSTRPRRTGADGPMNGRGGAITRAADGPMIDSTSAFIDVVGGDRPGSIWTACSIRAKNSGRLGWSMSRDVWISFVVGRPFRLMNPPGNLPADARPSRGNRPGQWKKSRPSCGSGRRHNGDERHGVADPDDHGSVGLLGEVAGLDAQELTTDGSLDLGALNRVAGHGMYLWIGCLSRTRSTRTYGWIVLAARRAGPGWGRSAASLR